MYRIYSLIICLFTLYACQSTKIDATPKQTQLQKEFAETTAFKINSNWANPMATASMNALSNSGLIAPGSSAGRIDISQNNKTFINANYQVKLASSEFLNHVSY